MSGKIDPLVEALGLSPFDKSPFENFPRRTSEGVYQPSEQQHPFEGAVVRREFEAWYPGAHPKAVDPLARYKHNGDYVKAQIETAWRAYLARARYEHEKRLARKRP